MRTWLLALGLLLNGSGLVCGQTLDTLTVHVSDAAGSPLEDTPVTASATQLWGPVLMQGPVTLKTDRAGETHFRLPPGIYRLSAARSGFEYKMKPNIEVGREDSQLQLALDIATAKPIPADEACYGDCATSNPPWMRLLDGPPLTTLIDLQSPIAPLALQRRLATKGMLRKRHA